MWFVGQYQCFGGTLTSTYETIWCQIQDITNTILTAMRTSYLMSYNCLSPSLILFPKERMCSTRFNKTFFVVQQNILCSKTKQATVFWKKTVDFTVSTVNLIWKHKWIATAQSQLLILLIPLENVIKRDLCYILLHVGFPWWHDLCSL
jgi:hypothetical protein